MVWPFSSNIHHVFVSHAGEDKETIAIPLRKKLQERNYSAFVDEQDIPRGNNAIQEITSAMQSALVAVIVLSPEYVAKEWPMKELLFFLDRRLRAERKEPGRKELVIIPVFYRLCVSELHMEPVLERTDARGESLYRKTRFFERRDNGEPEANIEIIKRALRDLRKFMGVKNQFHASNHDSSAPSRTHLLEAICNAVSTSPIDLLILDAGASLLSRTGARQVMQSRRNNHFQPYFHTEVLQDSVLDFRSLDTNGVPLTQEGRIKHYIQSSSPTSGQLVAIVGAGGVGKSTILKGLANDEELRRKFVDGIYLISFGLHATPATLFRELSKLLHVFGAEDIAERLQRSENNGFYSLLFPELVASSTRVETSMNAQSRGHFILNRATQEAMKEALSWFSHRRCMFLFDDIWTKNISLELSSTVFKLGGAQNRSTVVFTTREHEVASIAPQRSIFRLHVRDAKGAFSRKTLLQHAGSQEDDIEEELTNHAFSEILEICNGLPVNLAAAGKGVKMLKIDEGERAWSEYRTQLREFREQLLHQDVAEYGNLYITIGASVALLEKNREKLGFETLRSFGEMYRRLCVLQKGAKVPANMLRHLWELRSCSEAKIIGRRFAGVGLAEISHQDIGFESVWRLGMHDSLHDYAIAEARRRREVVCAHGILVDGYRESHSDLSLRSGLTKWWSEHLKDDSYVHANICRHLEGAQQDEELISLLSSREWVTRREMTEKRTLFLSFKHTEEPRLEDQPRRSVLEHIRLYIAGTLPTIPNLCSIS